MFVAVSKIRILKLLCLSATVGSPTTCFFSGAMDMRVVRSEFICQSTQGHDMEFNGSNLFVVLCSSFHPVLDDLAADKKEVSQANKTMEKEMDSDEIKKDADKMDKRLQEEIDKIDKKFQEKLDKNEVSL